MSSAKRAISKVLSRWFWNRIALIGTLLLFAGSLTTTLSLWFGTVAALVGLGCACLLSLAIMRRYELLRGKSTNDAALYLDEKLGSKERILTLTSDDAASFSKPAYTVIEGEVESAFSGGDPLPEFKFPRLFAVIGGVSVLMVGTLFFIPSPPISQAHQEVIAIIDEALRDESIPEEVKEAFVTLSEVVRENELSSVAVGEALENAKEEVLLTERELAGTGDSLGAVLSQTKEPTPTPSPSPSPVASPERQDKGEGEKNKTDTQHSKSASGENEEKKESEGESEKKEGAQGKEGQVDSDSTPQKSAQGAGKQDTNQQNQENKPSPGNNSQNQDKSQPSQNQSGAGEKKGEAKEQKGSSQGNSQQGGAPQQGNPQGRSQAQAALSKVEQKISQAQSTGGSQGDTPPPPKESSSSEGKSEGAQSQRDNKGDSGDKKPGDSGKSPGKGGEEKQGKEGERGEKKEPTDSQGERKNTEQGKSSDQNDSTSPSQESSLGERRERDRELEGGNEGEGAGSRNKKVEERVVGEKDENFDPSQTGEGSEKARNKEEARPKTTLADVAAAKPEAIRNRNEQPIPQEYQYLLR